MAASPKDFADLIAQYNTVLMGDANVRGFSASVAQDAQDETVDLVASFESVQKFAQGDTGTARRAIISWLNSVWLCTISDSIVATKFLWEMHTRITKLLIVSMVLEGRNLASFEGHPTPHPSDIPQCLVHLWNRIESYRKLVFPDMLKAHTLQLGLLPDDYVRLYLGK